MAGMGRAPRGAMARKMSATSSDGRLTAAALQASGSPFL